MIRTSTIFWCLLGIIASILLYHTSYRVQDLQKELDTLNEQIVAEREAVHVLKAEWAYLSAPPRIEQLSRKHLGTSRAKQSQVIGARQFAAGRPLSNEKKIAIAQPVPAIPSKRMQKVAEAMPAPTVVPPVSISALIERLDAR